MTEKTHFLCLLGWWQFSTKTHQRSKKKIKGHQRPNRVGKGCDKWMLLNSKKTSDWVFLKCVSVFAGIITWCPNIVKIYQRPPKTPKRSIKAVFKMYNRIGRKN